MYPLFHITPYIEVHFFGIFLVTAWLVFFWLLHKYSVEHGLNKNIFGDIVSYTLSIFFMGRIFYILSDWRNEKYIFIKLIQEGAVGEFLQRFFITQNYEITLAGGIIGFLIVFLWKIRRSWYVFGKSIDIIVRSFFYAATIGYTGALLGWQIYGIPFDSVFSLLYMDKNSIVPIGSARFPLPVLSILTSVSIALALEKIRKTITLPDGFLGYIGIWMYGIVLFLLEFTSGSADMFQSYPPYISLNQIIWLACTILALVWILRHTKI